jgi:hypothetical protein
MKTKNAILTIIIVLLIIALGYILFKLPVPNQPLAAGQKAGTEATATVYVKDPATGEFNAWNGRAFGQNNPLTVTETKGLTVILPTGEYYVKVEAPGYDTINSLVTEIDAQSVVTAKINLGRRNTFWEKIVSTLSPADASNNFSLNVTPLPEQSLMPIGEYLPTITAYDINGNQQTFLNTVYDKPIIIYVFSTWNTKAAEQMDIFESVYTALVDDYRFIPLSTLEPLGVNQTKIARGAYALEFFKPSDKFYDDYKIISLPQFFLATNKGELLRVITGSKSSADLIKTIKDVYAQ